MRFLITHSLTVIVLLALMAPTAFTQGDQGGKIKVLDAQRVYYPARVRSNKIYKKVGLVDSRPIFDATPEYQEIARQKLDRNSADYVLHCQRPSTRFKAAIKRTVSVGGYDVIAESGAVTVEGKVLPDITQEVLGHLSRAAVP